MGYCKRHKLGWRDGKEQFMCPECEREPVAEPVEADVVRLILKPLDDSNDQVLVCDRHGTVCGMLHVDAFLDGRRNPVYDALWGGFEVTVELRMDDE